MRFDLQERRSASCGIVLDAPHVFDQRVVTRHELELELHFGNSAKVVTTARSIRATRWRACTTSQRA